MKVFVSAEDVRRDFLGKNKCIFVDTRYVLGNPTAGGEKYLRLRAKGAVLAELDTVLSGKPTSQSGRHPLPVVDDFIQWCLAHGIGTSKDSPPIVCYDDFGGALCASRAWWMFDALGLTAYVLDGGIQAYIAAGLPTESGALDDNTATSSNNTAKWHFGNVFGGAVEYDDLPKYEVVEARAKIRVQSTVRPVNPLDTVPGGIPGAKIYEFQSNLDLENMKLKPMNVIAKQLTPVVGDDPHSADNHAYSCGSGVTACHNIAVTRQLGLGSPKLYVGSWSQYSKLFKDDLIANALKKHGVCMQIHKHNLTAAKFDLDKHSVVVNGKKRQPGFFRSPPVDKALVKALSHLHAGEEATILFQDGRISKIEVPVLSNL